MNFLEYWRLAIDSLAQNKLRSSLTMLGVVIGVMAVILLVALGEAAQTYISRQFDQLGTNLLRITPGKQETTGMGPLLAGSFRDLTNENAKAIRRQGRGIREVAPMVLGAGVVRHAALRRDIMVLGVTEHWESAREMHPELGRFIARGDHENNNPVCVLGRKVKNELFGDANPMHERIEINRRKFLVVGVMEPIGMTLGMDMDDVVFIPLSASQRMFHGGQDKLFQILVAARGPEDVDIAIESIRGILIHAHDYTEDFTITDQASFLATFNRVFLILRIMLGGLASISLLVGGIGIMNIMLVSVRERIREVGIRKAVGARREDIGLQFLAESVCLSAAGGVMGILAGYVATFFIRANYPILPVYLSAWSVSLAFGFSLAVGIFFGVYPALKASSVDPVEALRFE